jgi:hypothetical protein
MRCVDGFIKPQVESRFKRSLKKFRKNPSRRLCVMIYKKKSLDRRDVKKPRRARREGWGVLLRSWQPYEQGRSLVRQSPLAYTDIEDRFAILGQIAFVNHGRVCAKAILELGPITDHRDGAYGFVSPAEAAEFRLKGAVSPLHAVRREAFDWTSTVHSSAHDCFVAQALQVVDCAPRRRGFTAA